MGSTRLRVWAVLGQGFGQYYGQGLGSTMARVWAVLGQGFGQYYGQGLGSTMFRVWAEFVQLFILGLRLLLLVFNLRNSVLISI